jgi:hypothetical protein
MKPNPRMGLNDLVWEVKSVILSSCRTAYVQEEDMK